MFARRRPSRHGGKPAAARLCRAAMIEVISRGEFAARAGRSPSAVNRWVERGQLSGAALTADGRIVVDEAEAQLARDPQPVARPAAGADDSRMLGGALRRGE